MSEVVRSGEAINTTKQSVGTSGRNALESVEISGSHVSGAMPRTEIKPVVSHKQASDR